MAGETNVGIRTAGQDLVLLTSFPLVRQVTIFYGRLVHFFWCFSLVGKTPGALLPEAIVKMHLFRSEKFGCREI